VFDTVFSRQEVVLLLERELPEAAGGTAEKAS
jgi:hypothetical protein